MQKEITLGEIGGIVEKLQHLTQQLVEVVDNQTQAVVSADEQQIERYVEEYTELKGRFQEQEMLFIERLQALISTGGSEVENLRLEQLKELFPESSAKINRWKKGLAKQTQELKRKHQKLNTLLEFALERNVEFMRSLYSLNNQENTQYNSGGNKEEKSSGIAVNKEA